jgi:hypothetical protein
MGDAVHPPGTDPEAAARRFEVSLLIGPCTASESEDFLVAAVGFAENYAEASGVALGAVGAIHPWQGSDAALEDRLREWMAEEERNAAEARAAAESYRGVNVDAQVDMERSANRHEATARRIRRVLGEEVPVSG